MSLWNRFRNALLPRRVEDEIAEELQAHLDDAVAAGRDPEEARRAMGGVLLQREAARDARVVAWVDSLRSDVVFGVRQLAKNKVAAGAAVLSLGLALGASMASFRLIDALLFRPLPVEGAERLRVMAYEYREPDGKTGIGEGAEYPMFLQLREGVKNEAVAFGVSYASRIEIQFRGSEDLEKANRQYVSGDMFRTLGMRPSLGRLLDENDDRKPGAHPVAVLTHHYWQRRFGGSPEAIGKKFESGKSVYEIVGVAPEGFTGFETGTPTDIFVPMMMNAKAVERSDWSWFRIWLQLKPGANEEAVRQKLQAGLKAFRADKAKSFPKDMPKDRIEAFVNRRVLLEPSVAGYSGAQRQYRQALGVLAALVGFVLLIACVNVANLMTAQAAGRAREMALRVSIGAGRARLLQLVLVEGALLAFAASILGGLFSWWAAPFVLGQAGSPMDPIQLAMPMDWRVGAFSVALAFVVTFLFGLAPALRASGVKPAAALKGGEDPHSRRRLMHGLIAVQVAFCFLVHFAAGLFWSSFDRLTSQPLGFSADNVWTLETVSATEEPTVYWEQVAERLRQVPGVESAAICSWALMSGNGWSGDVKVDGQQARQFEPYFLGVSPQWLETMKIERKSGRDFRPGDLTPRVAIVNEKFAQEYFQGQDPVGKHFERGEKKERVRVEIVGWVRDARYRDLREKIQPTVYVPLAGLNEKGEVEKKDWATYVVRLADGAGPGVVSTLREEVKKARSGFRVSSVTTQQSLIDQHSVRERLLATLGGFFAVVALLLAAVGLYGVLDYSVQQRRREIGIRMALGAQPGDLARRVTAEVFAMLVLGSAGGLLLGLGTERYLETLLYEVKGSDWQMMAGPLAVLFGAAALAAVPPVIRAVRFDPAMLLRSE